MSKVIATLIAASLLAACAVASPASAAPIRQVASASDSGQYSASPSLSREVKRPRKLQARIYSSNSTVPIDFDYSVSCETKDDYDYQSGGSQVLSGAVVPLPTIYRRPKSCDVSISADWSDFRPDDPPPTTVTIELWAKQWPRR